MIFEGKSKNIMKNFNTKISKVSPIHDRLVKNQPFLKRKKNFLVIVYLVKKFIQILKTYRFVKKILRLKNFHFRFIGDKSNYYKNGMEFGDLSIRSKQLSCFSSTKTYVILEK